jgi:hypothetical protein
MFLYLIFRAEEEFEKEFKEAWETSRERKLGMSFLQYKGYTVDSALNALRSEINGMGKVIPSIDRRIEMLKIYKYHRFWYVLYCINHLGVSWTWSMV